MTRDEAIKILKDNRIGSTKDWEGEWVDRFAALGMLKLDKPKTVDEKFYEAMTKTSTRINIEWLFWVLSEAGLKLTEK
jgi:hypothetical protein